MSFSEQKRERIKTYLLEKIDNGDQNFISKVADAFQISMTSVKRYLNALIEADIVHTDPLSPTGYSLTIRQSEYKMESSPDQTTEDLIYYEKLFPLLQALPEHVQKLWNYCCLEMLNNVIDHSSGSLIQMIVQQNYLYTEIIIADDGIGAFQNIRNNMEAELGHPVNNQDILAELYKGKYTTDRRRHSGEGIFFTSRMADRFALFANGMVLKRNEPEANQLISHRLLAYAAWEMNIGTIVSMRIYNHTKRQAKEVFDMFSDIDRGFYKTELPLRDLCQQGEPVARSQARRIVKRLEQFEEVIIDFEGVDFCGQGFADEMFRVFVNEHPEIKLIVTHANPDVLHMLRHVGFAS